MRSQLNWIPIMAEIEKEAIEKLAHASTSLMNEMEKSVIGQTRVIREMLIALFSGAHCLIEGVPGLAKTLMIKTLGEVMDLKFSRIQFTPDLMPSDITGTEIIEENKETGQRSFRFLKGPIFTNLLLADEINRTPPKTQAALLQAMQEYCVTSGGVNHPLDKPFYVMATQNPVEQEGTYPLPEAQLDRFMFKIFIDYPNETEEKNIVQMTTGSVGPSPVPVLTREELVQIPSIIRGIPVSDHVIQYAVRLVRKSRPKNPDSPDFIKEWVSWGAGPRAALYLILGAKANAILRGSFSVATLDVRAVADPVMNHRILTNFNAEAEGKNSRDIIHKLLEFVTE
ncbi:MAG: MoxR family ATPase [Candidatus Aureabacteria bacterium]|nr:MoxR family ATPase [Candidatus Auribacterota bacterium]